MKILVLVTLLLVLLTNVNGASFIANSNAPGLFKQICVSSCTVHFSDFKRIKL